MKQRSTRINAFRCGYWANCACFRWLEEFLEQSKQSDAPVHATYVLSGEALPTPATDVNMNSMEDEGEKEFADSQASSSSSAVPYVPTWQILLTQAEDLERVPIYLCIFL